MYSAHPKFPDVFVVLTCSVWYIHVGIGYTVYSLVSFTTVRNALQALHADITICHPAAWMSVDFWWLQIARSYALRTPGHFERNFYNCTTPFLPFSPLLLPSIPFPLASPKHCSFLTLTWGGGSTAHIQRGILGERCKLPQQVRPPNA